jgi:hypothetical protein
MLTYVLVIHLTNIYLYDLLGNNGLSTIFQIIVLWIVFSVAAMTHGCHRPRSRPWPLPIFFKTPWLWLIVSHDQSRDGLFFFSESVTEIVLLFNIKNLGFFSSHSNIFLSLLLTESIYLTLITIHVI